MTRLPHENRDVRGLDVSDGPQFINYKVGPLCSVPGCSRLADHSHHIWRRSFVIGDKPWVILWDLTITGNLTALCYRHHQEVTENKAIIRWSGLAYTWEDSVVTSVHLDPQPPILFTARTGKDLVSNVTSRIFPERETLAVRDLFPDLPHEHVGPGAVEKCPTCSRALPRPESKREGPRTRKAWTVSVPVDERENGADVLDTLLTECAKIFGHDETKGARYFTVAQALALVVQHGARMVGDA